MNTTSAASFLASVLLAAAALPAGAVQQFPRHRNPLGFSLSLPQGWQVDTSVRNVIVVRDGSRSSWVAVQPFLLRAPAAAEEWLGQALGQLSWLLPQARIVRSARRPEGPNTLVASVRFLLDGKPAQASLLCVIHGRTGMLYGIGAEAGQFAARRPLLVQVLQSFRFETPASSPAGGAGGGARLAYVPWQDPRENAFTVEIPRGWSATGGLFRFSTVDVRGAMEIRSPDGQIRLIAGDPAVPPHTVPNQMLAMTGFPEGSWYSPGYNQRFLVRRYMPGVQFAVEYARSTLGAGCPDLRLLETRELPRESQQLSSLYRGFPGVAEMQVQAGETAFTGTQNGRPVRGYLFAGTLLISGQGYALWMVPFLHGFVASPEAAGTAGEALSHLIRSTRMNPQWVARQGQATAETSRIVSETHAFVSRTIDEAYWNRQRTQDRALRHWSNAMLGQTDVVDPETGETWTVANGHNYYWRKQHTDVVAGTDTYDPPDTSFTPLLEY